MSLVIYLTISFTDLTWSTTKNFCTDMVNVAKPDERAVMTYVSCYYHALQGAHKVRTFRTLNVLKCCYCCFELPPSKQPKYKFILVDI